MARIIISLLEVFVWALKLYEADKMGFWLCEECNGRGTHDSALMCLLLFFRKPRRCNRCHGTGKMQPPLNGPPKDLPNPPPKRRHND